MSQNEDTQDHRLTLRIPIEVFELLKASALKNKRSINSELLILLDQMLKEPSDAKLV
ncbi:MAG: Arc family DNA-binding protein [Chitinophagaceae bacterium]|nr:Arc family DNA-binding protein [Chitinophagaceae bacterium]